ncbi:maternal embryonic leucine zipper kinase-like [Oratosquilla oratoria]|uniref:maternal embryonic leucine zipper kinase-like n=1 Tax=Oratosquilla oratoria TaxID=337810 RepID=UPI003F764DF8
MEDIVCFSTKYVERLLRNSRPLGEGTFATAFLTSESGRALCVKTFFENRGHQKMTNEAEVLKALSGVLHVPELIGVSENPLALVTSFCGTTLGKEMKRTTISEDQAVNITLQVTEALRKIHDLGWAHNDLKLDNIVVEPRGNQYWATVIDFGNACRVGRRYYRKVMHGHIKFPHLAPEILQGEAVTSKSDVFSLGYVLKELTSRNDCGDDEISVLISQTIKYDPQERISIESALQKLREAHFNLFIDIIIDKLSALRF